MNLLKIHAVITWVAYLLGLLVSGYAAVVGFDQIFAASVAVAFGLHGSWMLHAIAVVSRGKSLPGLGSNSAVILTIVTTLSVAFIVLCMFGLFIDVTANGLEGLNVEAYISGLVPGVMLFFLASYIFARMLSQLGARVDDSKSRQGWLLWLSNAYFLIGFPVLWRQLQLIQSRGRELGPVDEVDSQII